MGPVLAMDEAGNTGENLLDSDQPVYALVAVEVERALAEQAVTAALSRTQMSELKFAVLRRSGGGRRNLLQLLDDLAIEQDQAAVFVADKAWMLAAKLVDELVEARMLAAGRQMEWYMSGEALSMAETLYRDGPRALGTQYADLAAAFVPMVRDYDPARAAAFIKALQRARLVVRDDSVHAVLDTMMDTEDELAAEFTTRADALDPHLAALWWQAGHWSQRFERFEIVHDESNTASRWAAELVRAAEFRGRPADLADADRPAEQAARSIMVGHVQLNLPVGMRGISFVRSDDDARVQVADVIAGSAAHVYAAIAGIRPEDGFSRDLERRGMGRFIREAVGRDVAPLRRRRLGLS